MKINSEINTGKLFVLKSKEYCINNDYLFDEDNDCFLSKEENLFWFNSTIDEICQVGFIDVNCYGKIVEVFELVTGDQINLCYRVNDGDDYSIIDDWMGKYVDPEKEPEYFV